MLPTYETDRLILRPRTMDDLEACLAMDLDPEVVKYIRPTPPEPEHRAFLQERLQMRFENGLGYWSIFEKASPNPDRAFIGWVLLVPLGEEGPEVEIGYRFVRHAWGTGYATEAAGPIRDHGFEVAGLDKICAVTHPDNKASQNVLGKLGLARQRDRFAYGMMLPYFLLEKESWLKTR